MSAAQLAELISVKAAIDVNFGSWWRAVADREGARYAEAVRSANAIRRSAFRVKTGAIGHPSSGAEPWERERGLPAFTPDRRYGIAAWTR